MWSRIDQLERYCNGPDTWSDDFSQDESIGGMKKKDFKRHCEVRKDNGTQWSMGDGAAKARETNWAGFVTGYVLFSFFEIFIIWLCQVLAVTRDGTQASSTGSVES